MPTGGVREDGSLAYYLDEKNALRVIRRCETDKADDVMDEVIAVYLAYRHGELPSKPPSNDLVAQAEVALQLAKQTAERSGNTVAPFPSWRASLDLKVPQAAPRRPATLSVKP